MRHSGQKFAWFFSGVLAAALVVALFTPALAASAGKTIQVYTGVTIYVDDVKLDPTDANGNPVEPFIYNGTTYLPVRAVGEAVGKTVQWEPGTRSVYLGKHTGEKPAVWLHELDYFTGKTLKMWHDSLAKDNLGNSYTYSIDPDLDIENTYLINGQYSRITGTLYQTYANRSSDVRTTLEIYGDGELLYTAAVTGGVKPVEFSVDLTGILELRIVAHSNDWYGSDAAIGDCGLWT